MKIAVFGLGYVGTVSAACFARDGHEVMGVDPVATKVALINEGRSPVIEAGLGELVAELCERGALSATHDAAEAVATSDISMICVGTPSQTNGSLDYRYLRDVCVSIGEALAVKDDFHVVVVRSTILPGTMRSVVLPLLESRSGRSAGEGFGVAHNPEFLREGTALYDFDHPPKTVIGEGDPDTGERVANLYDRIDAPLIRVDLPVAELVKYVDNCWHALKVGFANEIGTIAKAVGLDSHEVMDIFCRDTKLNIAPTYLRPGQAFGGSCLPKDLRALVYHGRSLDLELPILSSVLPSNALHMERALRMVLDQGARKVGVLGFSFKAGTDDLRESPIVELVERLLGKGIDLRLYDRNVNLSRLVGANRDFLLNHIPHISRIMVDDLDEVLEHGEVIVIGNNDPEFRGVLERAGEHQTVIDLVRIAPEPKTRATYDGICW